MLKGKYWNYRLFDADGGAASGGDAGAMGGGGSSATTGDNRDDDKQSADDLLKYNAALQKRLGERDDTINSLKSRLEALENAQRKALETTGNYEQLYKEAQSEIESLRPLKEGYSKLESVIRDANKQMIESIPETMRAVIPEGLSPDALNQWLLKSRPLLTRQPAPDIGAGVGAGGAGGGAKVTLTAEQKAMARRMNMTDEQFAEQLKKMGRDA